MTVTDRLADEFDLDAKYRVTDGGVLITGIQALVRVLLDQIRADRQRSLRTAAFVSGYPDPRWAGSTRPWNATPPCWPSTTSAGFRE